MQARVSLPHAVTIPSTDCRSDGGQWLDDEDGGLLVWRECGAPHSTMAGRVKGCSPTPSAALMRADRRMSSLRLGRSNLITCKC